MVGRPYGGTERMRDKYSDIVPGKFEMAVYAQNAADQFTDPSLMALNSEDAMERFQLQIMKTSTPEIRIPNSEDKGISGRKRAHSLITTLFQGGPRGPTEQAYKPEIVQSNRSTYTYSVPSSDPIMPGSMGRDVSGNSVLRLSLPNNPSNKEIGTRMFNTQNRIAKYAAATQRIENTSQLVDWIPQRKDRMWESRALDEYRKRLMPRIEAVDNADNVNREKNRCRDVKRISYRYRHKEYDVDRQLHEILDNNNRVLPEISSRQPDGTPIGNLIAELAKRGLANVNTPNEIPESYKLTQGMKSRKNLNPNKKGDTRSNTVFDHTLPSGEDKDGKHEIRRVNEKLKTDTTRLFNGLDDYKKEIVIGNVIDEIKREKKKKVKKRRKDTKNKSTTFDQEIQNDNDDEDGKHSMIKDNNVKYEDGDRKMMNFNVPILVGHYADRVTLENKNKKMVKKSGKGKGLTTNDYDYYTSDDKNNEEANRNGIKNISDKITNTSQGVRGLINDLVPEIELTRGNSSVNPNVKVIHKDGKIVWQSEANRTHSTIADMPDSEMNLSTSRAPINVEDALKRPVLPEGIVLDEQIDFTGKSKKMNKKSKQTKPVYDFP